MKRLEALEFEYSDAREATRKSAREARSFPEVAEQITVKDPNRMMLRRKVPDKDVIRLLDEAANAAADIKKLDLDYEVPALSQAIRKQSQAGRTVLHKVLESAANRSTNETCWRNAIMLLARPLYPTRDPMEQERWTEEDRLVASCCLRNIASRSTNTQKRNLVTDSLCGAMLLNEGRVGHEILTGMELQRGDMQFATIAALISTKQNIGYALDTFRRYGEYFSGQGQADALAMVKNGSRGTDEKMMAHILPGMRRIMNAYRIGSLPHPWYGEDQGYKGFPIPLMHDNGIHQSAFATLGMIPSGQALAVMTYGVGNLIIPHIEEIDYAQRRIVGEDSVVSSLGVVAAALQKSLSLNKIRSPEMLTELLLGHPELVAPECAEPARLMDISAVLYNIAQNAELLGLSSRPMAKIARAAVTEAMMSGVARDNDRDDNFRKVIMRLREMSINDRRIFGDASEDEMKRKYEMLMGDMKKKALAPAPRLLPRKR